MPGFLLVERFLGGALRIGLSVGSFIGVLA